MFLRYQFDSSIDELFRLISLIKFTKESCLAKEMSATYYNLNDLNRFKLSEERNDYINMLSIAEEMLFLLKEKFINDEKYYNSTPTIAADR